MVMKQNRRCSILFHLLVPGGKWQTVIVSLIASADSAQLSTDARNGIAAATVSADHQTLGFGGPAVT
jgi:hypothetical protein